MLALNTYLTDGLDRLGIETRSPRGAHRSGQTLCVASDPPGLVAFFRDRHSPRLRFAIGGLLHLARDPGAAARIDAPGRRAAPGWDWVARPPDRAGTTRGPAVTTRASGGPRPMTKAHGRLTLVSSRPTTSA